MQTLPQSRWGLRSTWLWGRSSHECQRAGESPNRRFREASPSLADDEHIAPGEGATGREVLGAIASSWSSYSRDLGSALHLGTGSSASREAWEPTMRGQAYKPSHEQEVSSGPARQLLFPVVKVYMGGWQAGRPWSA